MDSNHQPLDYEPNTLPIAPTRFLTQVQDFFLFVVTMFGDSAFLKNIKAPSKKLKYPSQQKTSFLKKKIFGTKIWPEPNMEILLGAFMLFKKA